MICTERTVHFGVMLFDFVWGTKCEFIENFWKRVNVSPSPSSRLSSGLERVTHSALACLRLCAFDAVCSNCQTVLNEASLLLWLPAAGVLSVSQSAACLCVCMCVCESDFDLFSMCFIDNLPISHHVHLMTASDLIGVFSWTTSLKFTANWVSSLSHSFTLHLSAWQSNVSLAQPLSLFLWSRHLQPFAYTPPPIRK